MRKYCSSTASSTRLILSFCQNRGITREPNSSYITQVRIHKQLTVHIDFWSGMLTSIISCLSALVNFQKSCTLLMNCKQICYFQPGFLRQCTQAVRWKHKSCTRPLYKGVLFLFSVPLSDHMLWLSRCMLCMTRWDLILPLSSHDGRPNKPMQCNAVQ